MIIGSALCVLQLKQKKDSKIVKSSFLRVNFLLHSHTYIKDAPFTKNVVPCEALEEFYEISDLFNDENLTDFYVNLRGHGSLALVRKTDKLLGIPYIERKLPEVHNEY